jgi:hypothetical protein
MGRLVNVGWALALFVFSATAMILAPGRGEARVGTTAKTEHSCKVNGCGPEGWFNAVVPDEIAGCSFKKACDAHDLCYSKCLPCHTFSDSPLCSGDANRKLRRTQCDSEFKAELSQASSKKLICQIAAEAYYLAVRELGDFHFRGDPPAEAVTKRFQSVFDAEYKRGKTSRGL